MEPPRGRRPAYLESELERDVRALARPHGRMAGTSGHEEAAAYLQRRMADVGLRPYAGTWPALHMLGLEVSSRDDIDRAAAVPVQRFRV